MRKLFFIFLLFILTPYIQAQEYIKNTKGDVIIQGSFGDGVKTGSGKLFLYEILGNDSYVLDSISVNKKSFVFKKRKFTNGVYRLTFNNETNALDFVINSSESDTITIQINNYRIKKGYSILNSIENKIKKSYTKKEESINSKIKLIRKSQKTKDQKILEIRALQDDLFQFGTNLNNQYPGTYFGMIISHIKSPYNDVKHLYFNEPFMVIIELYFIVFFFFRGTSKIKLPVPLSKPSSALFEMLSNFSLFNQTFCPSRFKHFRTHHHIFSDIEKKSWQASFRIFTFCFRFFL